MGVTGLGDRPPSRRALSRQGSPLVWPITVVDAGTFDNNDSATTHGTPLVICHMSWRQTAKIITQVGGMGTEH